MTSRIRTGTAGAAAASRIKVRCGQRRLLEGLDARRYHEPVVLRACPAVAVDLEPARVVEAAARHAAPVRNHFQCPGHGGAAIRAELVAQPAAGFVRAVLIGFELAAQ